MAQKKMYKTIVLGLALFSCPALVQPSGYESQSLFELAAGLFSSAGNYVLSPVLSVLSAGLYATLSQWLDNSPQNIKKAEKAERKEFPRWLFVYTGPIFATMFFLSPQAFPIQMRPEVVRVGAILAFMGALVFQKAGYGLLKGKSSWSNYFDSAAKNILLLTSWTSWKAASIIDTMLNFTRFRKGFIVSDQDSWKKSLAQLALGWKLPMIDWGYKNFIYPLFTGEEYPETISADRLTPEDVYSSGQKIAQDTIAKILVGVCLASLLGIDFSKSWTTIAPKLVPVVPMLLYSITKLPTARILPKTA